MDFVINILIVLSTILLVALVFTTFLTMFIYQALKLDDSKLVKMKHQVTKWWNIHFIVLFLLGAVLILKSFLLKQYGFTLLLSVSTLYACYKIYPYMDRKLSNIDKNNIEN